ncbi:kinase-like domain-containing protein [Desarmillaria tabescens]|uniref:Kinase-like domain-containing protein n=1 Tax=Armillaria tabescens TaxID=1929756 RepID=A0AA39MZS7_ARMTA|nr:kinase-like domain-containing protein [Desarmillaria tabescens]KAK0452208.1 kinase-like domain-containing protein [Desarmillaria tabescens]
MILQLLHVFLYKVATAAADGWSALFQSCPVKSQPKDCDIDGLDDQQIYDLCLSLPSEAWISTETGEDCPARISLDVIGKRIYDRPAPGSPPEALAQELVRNSTNIPVPAIRRVIPHEKGCALIVMDYIPGVSLSAAWPRMSLWQKIRTALTVRRYVRQLRSIPHPRPGIPGPLAEGGVPVPCISPAIFSFMRPVRGPFTTTAEFLAYFNTAPKFGPGLRLLPLPRKPTLTDEKLVLSHADLAPRNLIVGDDGQLWLIDFGHAGFYPIWFEYVNTSMDARLESGREYDLAWRTLIPFICDPYYYVLEYIQSVYLR